MAYCPCSLKWIPIQSREYVLFRLKQGMTRYGRVFSSPFRHAISHASVHSDPESLDDPTLAGPVLGNLPFDTSSATRGPTWIWGLESRNERLAKWHLGAPFAMCTTPGSIHSGAHFQWESFTFGANTPP